MSSEALNLQAIAKAIDQHNRNCEAPAVAVTMSGFEQERLGWSEIKGLPILVDPNMGTGRFRVVCDADHTSGESTEAVGSEMAPSVPVSASVRRADTNAGDRAPTGAGG